jgi:diguanylate cyclase (GGDEF)-like protein
MSPDNKLNLFSYLSLIAPLLSTLVIIFLLCRHKERKAVHKYFLLVNIFMFIYEVSLTPWPYAGTTTLQYVDQWWYWPNYYFRSNLAWLSLTFAAIYWLLTAASYSGRTKLTQGWRRSALYLPVVIIPFVILVNPPHHLWPDVEKIGNYLSLIDSFVFLTALIYTVWSSAIYHKFVVELKEKAYKKQAIFMTIGALLLLLGGVIYFVPIFFPSMQPQYEDLFSSSISIGILLSDSILAYALLRTGFLNVLPVALREIYKNMSDAVIVLDVENRILQTNPAALLVFPNIQPGESIRKYSSEIADRLQTQLGEESRDQEFEFEVDQVVFWVRKLQLKVQKDIAGSILIFTDITQRKRAEEQLAHDALHDRLTGLPNRMLLLDRLHQILAHSRRQEGYQFAVLFLDLDRFKLINDSLGHQTGDQLLITVAERLRSCLREVDTVARLGGDEFVILLESITGVRSACEVAMRVQEVLSQRIEINGHEVFTTASIGIAIGSYYYLKPDDILRDADIAMYQAKSQGHGSYVVFDKEMHSRISTMIQLEADLRRAIHKGEFLLHYQPIVVLDTSRIIGLEALLRWNHPQRGILAPEDFLPEAEESSLIVPIGAWVIEQACQDLSRWQSKFQSDPPLMMSINLSRRQITDPDFLKTIDDIVRSTAIPVESLAFEITENVIIEDDPSLLDTLLKLKSMGISLYVDDFGTGYSSLHLLPIYPIDTIKVDHSFIRRITNSDGDLEIVRTIVNLGRSLDKGVIAEGIETLEEFSQLQSLRCEQGQGFFLYKPLSSDEVHELLLKVTHKERLSN